MTEQLEQRKNSYDVFISYSKRDANVAVRVAEALKQRGYQVWWDRSLETGRHWNDIVKSQIAASSSVIVLWSNASSKSDWVEAEARQAIEAGQQLLPILIDDTQLPNWLSKFTCVREAQLAAALSKMLPESPRKDRIYSKKILLSLDLPATDNQFLGREEELKLLSKAWNSCRAQDK